MNPTKHRNHSLIMITLGALVACGLAPAVAAQGTATDADLRIEIESPDRAVATVEQRWDGAAAKSMRQSLDVFFGTGDGVLAESEVERIARATETDMRNQTLPFVSFDGQSSRVRDVQLSFEGAAGQANASTPLVMKHVIRLDLLPGDGEEHTLTVDPLWNGTVHVVAPASWAAQGGNASGNEATAEMAADTPVTFTFVPGAAEPGTRPGGAVGVDGNETPQESTGEGGAQPGERPNSIPAGGALVMAAALAVAAMLSGLRRRRR
jgi:hypothetical protein